MKKSKFMEEQIAHALRGEIERAFATLAQLAMFDGPNPEIVQNVAPAAKRLADLLAVEDTSLASASGWPRRLSPAEIAERMKDHNVELAMIEANEEAARREVEGITWGNPPRSE